MKTVEVDAEHRSILGPSVCKDPPIWMGHLRDAMALIPTGPLADALTCRSVAHPREADLIICEGNHDDENTDWSPRPWLRGHT